jgi:hypothetical protein
MPVLFDHGQAAVSQILLQQQKVSSVYQEMGSVGVPEQVGMQPGYFGRSR